MKLLSATQCCRQKFHGVYVRETCFKRFLEFHEIVSSNRTLLYFLKLVSYFSRLLANHSSAISEGQFTCNCKKVFSSSLGPHFEAPLTKHGEPHIYFFFESIFLHVQQLRIIRDPFKCCIASAMTIRHNGTTVSSSSVSTILTKALCICIILEGKSHR